MYSSLLSRQCNFSNSNKTHTQCIVNVFTGMPYFCLHIIHELNKLYAKL